MKNFAFLRRKQLVPAWEYGARGVLWQIHHGSPHCLVGEARRMEDKRVSFFCLDRTTGTPHWENLNPADRWWSGIEAVHEDVVLIHGFASPDMPLHRGITAVDLWSGRVLWSRPDVRFSGVQGSALSATVDGGGSIGDLSLDVKSGVVLEGEGEGRPSRVESAPAEFPVWADGIRCSAAGGLLPVEAVSGSVVVLETGSFEVWGYYLGGMDRERQGLRSELVVVEKSTRSERFRDTLISDGSAVSSGQFFVQEETLYYIKDRSRLRAVRLRGR